MDDPLPPAPLRFPPVRLDPPPDVQAAVASALHACHAWQPAPSPGIEPGQPTTLAPVAAASVEAGVCDLIDDWPRNVDAKAAFMLSCSVALGLCLVLLFVLLRRGLRGLWRTRAGVSVQAALCEPGQDYKLNTLCGLLGGLFTLLLAKGLSCLGLDAPSAWWFFAVVGGLAGSILAGRLRRILGQWVF